MVEIIFLVHQTAQDLIFIIFKHSTWWKTTLFVNSETFILHLQAQHYCSLYCVSPDNKSQRVHRALGSADLIIPNIDILPLSSRDTLGSLCTGLISNSVRLALWYISNINTLPLSSRDTLGSLCTGLISNSVRLALWYISNINTLPLSSRDTLGSLCTGLMSSSVKLCRPHSGLDWHTCVQKIITSNWPTK